MQIKFLDMKTSMSEWENAVDGNSSRLIIYKELVCKKEKRPSPNLK